MLRPPLSVLLLCCLGLLSMAPLALAQPTTVTYQGELAVSGNPHNAAADFLFAIVCGNNTLWSNDGTVGNGAQPTTPVKLTVESGIFSVALGDPALGMPPILADALNCATPVLRVWVNTGSGVEQLTDQPFSSSPYALRADIASRGKSGFTVEDGALLIKDPDGSLRFDIDPEGGDGDEGAGMRMINEDGTTTLQLLADVNGRRSPELRLFDALGTETIKLEGAGGEIEVRQIRFPDNSVQSTAGTANAGDTDWEESGGNVYRMAGDVGIGTSTPSSRLHLTDTGSVNVHIEADSDNSNESDHALLRMSQDGGLVATDIGWVNGSNQFRITRVDGADTLAVNFSTNSGNNLDVTGDLLVGGDANRYDSSSEVVVFQGQSADWSIGVQNETSASASGFFIGTGSNTQDQFHIERGGDVGIGTEAPTAKLDVRGDLKVTGDLILSGGISGGSVVTRYHSIPAASFIPEEDDMDIRQNGYNCYGETAGQFVRFWAPIQLPHDATMTEVRFVVDDVTSLSNANIRTYITRWPKFGGTGTTLGFPSTVGAPGAYAQLASTLNVTIDNENYDYFVGADWTVPSTGNLWDLRLRNTRVTYEVTEFGP